MTVNMTSSVHMKGTGMPFMSTRVELQAESSKGFIEDTSVAFPSKRPTGTVTTERRTRRLSMNGASQPLYRLITYQVRDKSKMFVKRIKRGCLKWVPHKLADMQKDRRVDWSPFMIAKFDGGEKENVYHILTEHAHCRNPVAGSAGRDRVNSALSLSSRVPNHKGSLTTRIGPGRENFIA
ncbi:hypothetical protein EVAR_38557_1 [Eumeta japonica]|uniref:Mariner Mos1 transposase n=1 Tax=Eumeta variegata TaxID=151549 RepID=A0A4C1WW82_EUMVA|nr:hypothetical protein EVAR_38557_1 [Eumeta japonica]